MEKIQWKTSNIISKSWIFAKKEMIVLIGLFLLYQVILTVLNMFSISTELINAALSNNPQAILDTSYSGSQWFFQLLIILMGCWFPIGMAQLTLNIAKGEEVNFEIFITALKRIPAYIGATILILIPVLIFCSLLIGVPIALLLTGNTIGWIIYPILALIGIPILWFYFRVCLYPFFIVDKNYGGIKALIESFHATKGSSIKIAGVLFLSCCFLLLGLLALIIGVFVAYALVMMIMPVLYLTLTGYQKEEIAEPTPAPIKEKTIKEEDYMPIGSIISADNDTRSDDNKEDASRFMPK